MSQSPSLTTPPSEGRRRLPGRQPWSWRRAVGLGLCFGLGYGLTLRLLDLSVVGVWRDLQRFGVQSFPGTELDSLRKQFGDPQQEIRSDLDRLELERLQKRDAAELSKRQAEMAAREQAQQQQSQEDRQQLDALQQEPQDSLPSPTPEPAQEPLPAVPSALTPPPPAPAAPAPAAPAAEAPAANSATTP